MEIRNLVKRAGETARKKGFHDEPRSFGDIIALIHSEASEALEADRENLAKNEIYFTESWKAYGIPIEMADILIRVFDVCWFYGIDLEEALSIKMGENEQRGYKHGKEY